MYASVRPSRDSLHRGTHSDKKSRGGAVLWNRLSYEAEKIHGDVFFGTVLWL